MQGIPPRLHARHARMQSIPPRLHARSARMQSIPPRLHARSARMQSNAPQSSALHWGLTRCRAELHAPFGRGPAAWGQFIGLLDY